MLTRFLSLCPTFPHMMQNRGTGADAVVTVSKAPCSLCASSSTSLAIINEFGSLKCPKPLQLGREAAMSRRHVIAARQARCVATEQCLARTVLPGTRMAVSIRPRAFLCSSGKKMEFLNSSISPRTSDQLTASKKQRGQGYRFNCRTAPAPDRQARLLDPSGRGA